METVKKAINAQNRTLEPYFKPGNWGLPEADESINESNQLLIRAYLSEFGQAYLGCFHPGENKPYLWEHREGEKVYTFGSNFVLPAYSEKLETLLRAKDIDGAFDLVTELNGNFLLWT